MSALRNKGKVLILILMLLPVSADALTVEGLLNLVERSNLDIALKKHELKSKVYSRKSTLRAFFPTFSLQSSATLFYPYRGFSGKYWNQSYSYGFSVTANPVNFQRFSQLKIDRYYIDYSSQELSETRLDEYLKALEQFIKLEGWKEKLRIRRERLESAEKIYRVSVKKRKEGLVLLSDVLKAKANLERSRKELETARNGYRKVENRLREILNVSENVDITPEFRLKERLSLPDSGKLLEVAERERPSVRKAKRLVDIEEESVNLEKRSLYPSVSLNISYSRQDYYWPPEDNSWSLSAVLQWPIFDSGQTKYRALAKMEERSISLLKLKREINRVRRQVLNAISDFESARANVKSAKEYLEFARRSYRRTFQEYKKGVSDIVSLLTAFDELKSAQEQFIDTLVDLNIAYFKTLRYSGTLLSEKAWRKW